MVMLVSVILCGCGGSHLPEVPEGATVSYREHVEPLVLKRCLSCHTHEDPKAGLVFEEGVGYDRMVDRPSKQAPAMSLVAPGEPESSYLWLKLDQRPIKGEGMPRSLLGAKRLPDRELERFRRWIADGALP
jgi:hypothetical protein